MFNCIFSISSSFPYSCYSHITSWNISYSCPFYKIISTSTCSFIRNLSFKFSCPWIYRCSSICIICYCVYISIIFYSNYCCSISHNDLLCNIFSTKSCYSLSYSLCISICCSSKLIFKNWILNIISTQIFKEMFNYI